MTKDEALKMAIEAMTLPNNLSFLMAIIACKEALEQPKEPQYLYVYKAMGGEVMIESKPSAYCGDCIGKIKLEVDDD